MLRGLVPDASQIERIQQHVEAAVRHCHGALDVEDVTVSR